MFWIILLWFAACTVGPLVLVRLIAAEEQPTIVVRRSSIPLKPKPHHSVEARMTRLTRYSHWLEDGNRMARAVEGAYEKALRPQRTGKIMVRVYL